MTSTADIVIAGGGFTGLAAAAALADLRLRVVVLEASAGDDSRFRGELIHPRGVDVLEALGLLDPLKQEGYLPFRGFAVRTGPGDPATVLPYAEIASGRPAGLVMDHGCMVASLRRHIGQHSQIDLRMGHRVSAVIRENDKVCGLRTLNGEEFRAPLTLVAEGRHSHLRRELGFSERARLLSLTAAALFTGVPLAESEFGRIYLGAPGPILLYTVGGGVRLCIDLPLAAQPGGNTHQAVAARVKSAYMPFLPPEIRGALTEVIDSGPLEMCGTHEIRTTRCVLPGVALLGDAGGCSHPLAASGMLTGLNDVEILADEIRTRGITPSALDAYQRRRYRFARAREVVSDALYEVFRGADAGSLAIRDGMFRYWQAGPHQRAASMALLAGYDSRFRAFVVGNLRVLWYAIPGIFSPRPPVGFGRRVRSVHSVVRTSCRYLNRAAESVIDGALR